MSSIYLHPEAVTPVEQGAPGDSQSEQLVSRVVAKIYGTKATDQEHQLAQAIIAELAKQAGSVEPVAWMVPGLYSGEDFLGRPTDFTTKKSANKSWQCGWYSETTVREFLTPALAAQAAKISELELYKADSVPASIAAQKIAELEAEIAKLKPDAERYQWLREQHRSKSELCVVERPEKSVLLGSSCPPQGLLDATIAAARNAK